MGLRAYQTDALAASKAKYEAGVNRQLIVKPTGTGKTKTFSEYYDYLGLVPRQDQILIVVQRDELCWQTVKTLEARYPRLKIGMEKAQYQADPNDDIIVASIQTIGKTKKEGDKTLYSDRLKKFNPERFKVLVFDEAHHLTARSYHDVLRYFKVYKQEEQNNTSNTLLMGFTATPGRSDNIGLEMVFDEIVYSKDIREMISDGWLADIAAYRVDTLADISGVKSNRGEFQTGDLEKAVNTPERNNLVVDKYLEFGNGWPALAFTVDVTHSNDLAECFRKRGIQAYAISGSTPEKDRKRLIEWYGTGKIQVLVSCQVLLEGFDAPNAAVGLCARPTKSGLLYRQMVGRVLRPYPAPEAKEDWNGWTKPNAVVIDFVDICGRHRLNSVPTLFGLRPDFDLKGKKALDTVKEIERVIAQKKLPLQPGQVESVEKLKSLAEKIDLLGAPAASEEARQHSRYSWVSGAAGSHQLFLPDFTLRLTQDALGHWQCFRSVNGVSTFQFAEGSLQSAISRADGMVPETAHGLVMADAAWRDNKPSEKQADFLWSLAPEMRCGFSNKEEFYKWVSENKTKGELSAMIGSRLGNKPSGKSFFRKAG